MAEAQSPEPSEEMKEMMEELHIDETPVEQSPIPIGGILGPESFDFEKYKTNMNVCYETDGDNCYCGIDGTQFKVRGQNYLKDKKKFVSKPNICTLRGCDMYRMDEKPLHFCSRPESLPAKVKAAGGKDFFFVYNIIVTYKKKYISLCQYHTIPDGLETSNPTARRMIDNMINDEKDAWKTKHIKLIPTVVVISLINILMFLYINSLLYKYILKCVGSVPCIVGKKLKQVAFKGDNYIEIDMDVSKDKMISKMCEMCFKMAKSVVMDLGFVLEATNPEDLPEQMLSGIRLCRPDLTDVPLL
ncbi:hypothetical protein WA158_005424 [Blastocystis sp. Blastoise]